MSWVRCIVALELALVACSSSGVVAGAEGTGDASTDAGTGSSGGDASEDETVGAESTGESPMAIDCDDVPQTLARARWWTSAQSPDAGVPVPFASATGGRAAWLVGDALTWIDPSGAVGTPIAMPANEHATAIVGTPRGSMLVAGWRNAGVNGEVDAFLVEYDEDGSRGRETTWNLAPDANETPIAIVTSPKGSIAVLTQAGYDVTMPDAESFVRLDRFDAALALAHSLVLDAAVQDLAIDDDGVAYLASTGASVLVAAIDREGATLWGASESAEGATLALAVGDALVWLAQPSSDGFGGGSLRALDRSDGTHAFTEMFDGDDLSQPIETPVDVAASPCGGAWLLAEGRYDGDTYATFSYFDDDGTRSAITNAPQPPPTADTTYGKLYGIDRGADGTVVVVGRLNNRFASRLWASAF